MANRITTYNTFAALTTASTVNLDQNFTYTGAGFEDSSLGWNNAVTTDTGTANNYVVTLPYGVPTNYNVGFLVEFVPSNTNTGASNITISPLGAATIVDSFGNALAAGAIAAGKLCMIVYTGTNFRLVNNLQTGGVPYGYDWDDFVHASYSSASYPYATKLLAAWGSSTVNSSPYNTQVNGHPGIWLVKGSGPSGYGILGVPVSSDPVLASPGSGLFLESQTSVLMRSILNLNQLSVSSVDISFGLWASHNNALSGTHSFLGFAANSALGSNWLAYANNAGTITSTSTGVALTTGLWYTLEFSYAASTGVVTFFINGTQVATISTNVPLSTNLFPTFQVSANAGSTTSEILVDTYEILVNPGTASRFLYAPV